jgi:hypothetical protein
MLRRQGDPISALRNVYAMGVGENYFRTLNVPILRGRDLEIADRGRTPIPVVVNRTCAHDVFEGSREITAVMVKYRRKSTNLRSPCGRRVRIRTEMIIESPATNSLANRQHLRSLLRVGDTGEHTVCVREVLR